MDQNNIAGALTFPNRNEEATPEQPRQPRNLQGLLRFAMEATKAEDAPGNSELGPMDEERRKFLEEALKSLTVNLAEVIQNAIKVLSDEDKMRSIQLEAELPDDVLIAFNNIMEYIDDIDVANDFYKMGGFSIFPICFGSENEEVRSRASQALAELCQNNPYCQARTLECGLLNVLVHLASSEQGTCLAKCILAISCASREYEPACREVCSQGGCVGLAAALGAAHHAARTKAAFFVRYLCQHYQEAREKFIELNIVKTIIQQIKPNRDDSSEHLLGLLQSLVDARDPRVLQQCRDPSLNAKQVLKEHMTHPDFEGDDYEEEKNYCQDILNLLNKYPDIEPANFEADR